MSEQAPQASPMPAPIDGHFVSIDQVQTANSAPRYYGVDEEGKKTRVGEAELLSYYNVDHDAKRDNTTPMGERRKAFKDEVARRDAAARRAEHTRPSSFNEWEHSFDPDPADAAHNSNERQAQIRVHDDAAELRVFGSRGRVDADGNTIPGVVESANKRADEIIANVPANEQNMPQVDRNRLAKQRRAEAKKARDEGQGYVDEVLGLVNSGEYSLSQAELVVNLRRADIQNRTDFVDSRVADLQARGVSATAAKRQANSQADAMYARKDAKRLEIIKKNRLYSEAEYTQFTSGGRRNTDNRGGVEAAWDEAHAENADVDAERAALQAAGDRYIQLKAEMRNGHLGRVAGGRLRRFMKLFRQGVSGKKSDQLDTRVAEAREEYQVRFAARVARLEGHMNVPEISQMQRDLANLHLKVDELTNLEHGTLAAQQARTAGQKHLSARNRLAQMWANSGRWGKIGIVAIPAVAIGATGGLAAGIFGLGGGIGTAITAAGTIYAGRKAGQGVSSVATTNRANTVAGGRLLQDEANAGIQRLVTHPTYVDEHGVTQRRDHTEDFEQTTDMIVDQNQRRRGAAGFAGAVIAGAAFAGAHALASGAHVGGHGAGHNSAGHHTGNTHHTGGHHNGHHNGGHHNGNHQGPQKGHNLAPKYDTHQYPWTVAHQMAPGHEMSTIHHAMNASNANNGTGYHLVRVGNTMQVYNHGHALNAAQEAHFNTVMEALK